MTRLIWNKQILWIASATNHATILFIAKQTKTTTRFVIKMDGHSKHDAVHTTVIDLIWIGSGNGNKCNNQSRHAMHSPSIARYYSLRK
mmetsp:Transcript_12600/g.27338  ORF Transcript_12600/g.27338 Transcript_12600/m.27338 type:complete len:88 (-) Transcript_12600:153-416(-)